MMNKGDSCNQAFLFLISRFLLLDEAIFLGQSHNSCFDIVPKRSYFGQYTISLSNETIGLSYQRVYGLIVEAIHHDDRSKDKDKQCRVFANYEAKEGSRNELGKHRCEPVCKPFATVFLRRYGSKERQHVSNC